MKTNTQYVKNATEVKKYQHKMITLAEAYDMGEQRLREHFENVALKDSHVHEVTISIESSAWNPYKNGKWVGGEKYVRIAKRYRVKGRV